MTVLFTDQILKNTFYAMHSQLEDSAMSYCPPGAAPRFWKWGGTILWAERAKKIFWSPHFLASGGDKILLR